jgi:hypothetical protein
MSTYNNNTENLPGLFAIRVGPDFTYRLYTTKIFNNINILSPVTNNILENKYIYPITRNNNGVTVRKWYDTQVIDCMWTYTGIEFSVLSLNSAQRIRVPLIFFIIYMPNLLPVDSEILKNMGGNMIEIAYPSTYVAALEYSYDPFAAVENNSSGAQLHVPVAVPTSIGVPLAPEIQMPPPIPRNPSRTTMMYPPHIKRLIIEDVIMKKEPCPISCDDITQENASVTSCGHVFIRESIARWLGQASSEQRCPICKQKCHIT